jgi:hypothetical protein
MALFLFNALAGEREVALVGEPVRRAPLRRSRRPASAPTTLMRWVSAERIEEADLRM